MFAMVWHVATPAHALSDQEKLQRAEANRLDNHRQAQELIDSIDISNLSRKEKELYWYLKNWLRTFDGNDLLGIYERYGELVHTVESAEVKIRVLTSQLSLASYLGKWAEGFTMANKVQTLLSDSLSEAVQASTINGMITFYIKAEQPQIAKNLIQRFEPIAENVPGAKCLLGVQKIDLLLEQDLKQLSLNDILNTKLECERANNSYHALYSEMNLFYYLVETGNLQQAKVIMGPLEKKVETLDFVFMKTGFLAYVSELYKQQGQLVQAYETAQDVLSMDVEGQYLPTKIQALEILIDIAKQQANFEQAVAYMETLESLRAEFRELSVVKQAAFQQANFELALKQSQIDLLDKRNKLLETRSALSKARVQTTLIALCFVGVVMLGLLAWIWRSRKLQKKLSEMARIDSLTGIFNRGYFLQSVKQRLVKAQNKDLTCCLLLLDLDHFKRVNDSYGHQAGDWVLTEVVRTLKVVCDEQCTLGRMGGEEFAIFVYDTDLRSGLALAEQCRSAIEGIDTAHSGYRFPLTASFGVSDTTQVGYRFENLSSASDLALYQSKQYGRNRVYEYDINIEGQGATP
ncbi:hypothetical protein GCM10007391_07550 [Alteromonas halophila]|uniref:diguanylate cyclase n=1 Tax=Alteromonas halophila TaxID=516698 RepID=A0A918MWT3_9ALTE|nr:hypothetical protein GCM10007391_07550 [Alteromonas halophila]